MSDAFPNPYDPPAAHAEPHAQPAEDEDEELSRAIRESLALEAEAKERARREEQEALQAAIAASRDEESRRREQEQQALLQERKALEQSRQEARRREAELQRQALLEMEILEQSRREHEAAMQFREFREPVQPLRRSTVDMNAEESLLWLDAPSGSGSARSSAASSAHAAAVASSSRAREHADLGPPPSYTPRDSMRSPLPSLPTPAEPVPTPAPPAPARQTSFPNPYDPPAAPTPQPAAEVGPAPPVNPFVQDERALSPTQLPISLPRDHSEPGSPSSSSSFTVSSTASQGPPELPPPPQSRYEAALAAAAAAEQQDADSDDSWAESPTEERPWRAPVHDHDDDDDEAYDGSARTAYDEALARSNGSLDHAPDGAQSEGPPTNADDDEAHRIPIVPLVPTQVPIVPLQPRRWSEERELPPAPADTADEAPPPSAYALDDQPWAASAAPAPPSDAASLRSQDRSSSRASTERRPGVFGEAYPPENASGQPALRGVQFGFADSPYALELFATPTAAAPLYARPDLSLDPHVPAPAPGSVEEYAQLFFPERITLSSGPGRVWFVVRTYSWKVLLQALAWYGHAVVDAASPGARLQPEIAFCMPRRIDAPHTGAPTFVSLAMGAAAGPAASAASLQPLEAYAARLGAAVTPVSLAQHAVALPTDFMTFAQTLFSAPQLSSAPALRELRQTIARHDEWLLTRRDELVLRARAHAGQPGAKALDRAEVLEWSLLQHQLSLLQPPGAPVGAPVESPIDAQPSGHREHFRQRVRKKLARWGGGHARDEDLTTWITPYDLAQHGHAPADLARDASPMPR
ncbi:hypothetical protein MBRA1_003791 [Malassezia brasiliensis]|uniref:Uncharacterized protein n=1 Tax=Malassezia brasiliensis TaxID=1821822 RepID=A0AAF0IRF6_9BASI|nr:hypothetical protein MBRA1_003791 [Malassezia brasiliensis]